MLEPSSIGLTADPSKECCCLGWKLGMNGSNDEVERHIVEGHRDESSSGSTEEFSPGACMDTRTWGHLCYAVHPLNDPLNDEVERHC